MPRDIAELRALAERQPELAPAAQLQIELVESARRVQGRLSTPWIEATPEALAARLASGRALLDFDLIAFEWNDVRLLVRQIADVLRRHEAIDADAGGRPACPRTESRAAGDRCATGSTGRGGDPGHRDGRRGARHGPRARTCNGRRRCCSSAWTSTRWRRATCPVCAAEPDFSVVTTAGDRQLVCGRCHVRWRVRSDRVPVLRQCATARPSRPWPRPTASTG